ncbi:hypothetical protein AUC68_14740 [Methyloceanibacter methanicus]|uniref:Glycosyl transferase family 1 n=1 Tax=Methyloceanibacter methanicus TaxID=1774968 RepID=A0A1E3W493_9HYPH|nr:hypothetical protein AUC68_14740 [Methyloceanibacter methanicus]
MLQTQAEAAGAQEISRILDLGLTQRGYDVHNIYLYRRTGAFDEQSNSSFCAMERPHGPLGLLKLVYNLVARLRALRPEILICFQDYGNIAGAVAAKLAGVPYVIANRNGAAGLVAKWVWPVDKAFGTIGLFDRVVVNCKAVADEYLDYPASYRARILRIDHGFDPKRSNLSKVEARQRFGFPKDVTLLGTIGRLSVNKHLDSAIRLLANRDWSLAIAGQGPDRESLETLARSLGVSDRVSFVGELPPEGVAAFLRALDVFVFPTRMETFGLAGVEAAAAGVPVVANDLPVLREVLAVDGKPAAVFVDTTNAAGFVHAVDDLLGNKTMRDDICARGRSLPGRYGRERMVDEYAALIEGLRGESPYRTL